MGAVLIQSTETGEVRELPRRLQYAFQLLKTAEVRTIATATPPAGTLYNPITSPDGRTLFYLRFGGGPSQPNGILARDLQTGDERMVYVGSPQRLNFAMSPDGRQLAFIPFDPPKGSSLVVMPAEGGEPRVLHRRAEGGDFGIFDGLVWTPDGRHLLFVQDSVLFKIPVTGGEPQPLLTFQQRGNPSAAARMPQMYKVRMHPDGRRIAFNAGEGKAEVWVMENLPSARPE